MQLLQTLRHGGLAMVLITVLAPQAMANGKIGDHVNHLSDHVGEYTKEVNWLIDKVDGIVERYAEHGAKAARAEKVVDYWESVDFHAAIESNYVPLYASIWQGLYGVKTSIEKGADSAQVKVEQLKLEQALWQSLGAVKLASQFQDKGLLQQVALRDGAPRNSIEALHEVSTRLDRVVAKYAEQLNKEALGIVYDTYMNLFEGVEGELIAQDADLVAALEKDFNVTLPKAIEDNTGVDNVRAVVESMQDQISQARSLLEKAKREKKDVF